jgi:tRNA(Ile2) C34 agmatinyltransferase TiaS
MEMFSEYSYHVPKECEKCGSAMIFKGVGEYQCEKCGFIAFDDYGKVRIFLEQHPGANSRDVEEGTGVSGRAIRQMLREDKLEVAPDSKVFIRCEICGRNIRSGMFCPECEVKYRYLMEENAKRRQNKTMQGFGMERLKGEKGEKRFVRGDQE